MSERNRLTAPSSLIAIIAALAIVGCDDSGGDGTSAGQDTVQQADVADTGGAGADTTVAKQCPAPTGARPAARAEHSGIYDPVGHQIVFFGGSFGVPVMCSTQVAHTYENETWIYDIACDLWRKIEGPDTPKGRVRHAAVYDSKDHRMLVYGGRERAGQSGSYTLHGEVLAFDLATETWSQLPTTGDPPARFNAATVYDAAKHRLVTMGGNTSSNPVIYRDSRDVWALDLATNAWSQVVPTGGFAPDPRFWQAALWDEARQWLVIFGGSDAIQVFSQTADYFEDVWALDFAQDPPVWYQLNTGLPEPQGRFWGGLFHDRAGDRYLLFGGHDDQALGNRNDLWAFEPLDGTWELLRAGDTKNRDPISFCNFPPDFTNVDKSVPERRHAGVMVSDGAKAWISGGKTDCGNVDDVFELDLVSETWTELVTATTGEACIRKGGLNCNDMCF